MSNTNDPRNASSPDQPDPKKPGPGHDEQDHLERSSFDFQLPDDVGSFGDLPPIPQPETNPTAFHKAAIPPRPATKKPSSNTFDFLDVQAGDSALLSKPSLHDIPTTPTPIEGGEPPVLTPSDSSIDLPLAEVEQSQPESEASKVHLGPVTPPTGASSAMLGSDILEISKLPGSESSTLGKASVPDIGDLYPQSQIPDVPSHELRPQLPEALSDSDFELPVAEPLSGVMDSAELPALPTLTSPTPDLESALPHIHQHDAIEPPEGWLHPTTSTPSSAGSEAPAGVPATTDRSSFEFVLPEGVRTYSDMPPVDHPEMDQSAYHHATVPPRPEATRPASNTFDFIDLPAETSSKASLHDIPSVPTSIEQAAPLLTPTENVIELPPVQPVQPAADWVDSDAAPAPASVPSTTDSSSDPYGKPPPATVEGSDIFSGTRPPAEPSAEQSDVITATAYGAGRTEEGSGHPMRLSDVAINFSPDSGTKQESGITDLPLAQEAESATNYAPPVDSESIHDIPDPSSADPLFDSSRLSGTPSLPAGLVPRTSDTPDYGAVPPATADTSSILSELSDPEPGLPGADSSAVRVEAPGIDRTFSNEPAEELIPSGDSDLFSPNRTAPDFDLQPKRDHHAPTDADLEVEPASRSADRNDEGAVDWDSVEAAGSASHSGVLRDLHDPAETPTRDARPLDSGSRERAKPSVTVDWMAGSGEGSALREPLKSDAAAARIRSDQPSHREAKAEPAKTKPAGVERAEKQSTRAPARPTGDSRTEPAKKGGGMLVGLAAGVLLAGGAWAGVYFSGMIPNSEKSAQNPPPGNNAPGTKIDEPKNPPNGQQPPAAANPLDTLAAGKVADALKLVNANPATTAAEKAAAGTVRVYAKIGGYGTDDDLKQGQDDLRAAINEADQSREGVQLAVKATIDLGASLEASGDIDAARKLFTDAKAKYQPYAEVFDALLDKLNAPPAPGTSFRITPADIEQVLVTIGVCLADDLPKKADEPEAGQFYWKAVKLAGEGKYDEAIKLIGQAKDAHIKRAKLFPARGLNPLTDPLEQMFPRACDELAASWALRADLYRNPGIADAIKKDGLAKTLDSLAKSQTDLATAKTDLTKAQTDLATAKTDLTKAQTDLATAKTDLTKAQTDLATAKTDLTKSQTDLATVKTDLTKSQTDLATAKTDLKSANDKVTKLETDVAKLDKDVKAVEKARTEAENKLKVADKALTEADGNLKAALKDAQAKDAIIASIAEALKPAVKLPNKWGPDDVVAGAKTAAARATAPSDLAEKLTKAEAAAKAATDKLATEIKRLTAAHEQETKKLKEASEAETKTLTEKYAADVKALEKQHTGELAKVKETHTADVKALEKEHAGELAKVKETHTADLKNLTDKHKDDLRKLADDHAAAVKAEQAKTEAVQRELAAKNATFQKQLGSAITPAQALDIWLRILTEMRRAADAEPAMEMAKRTLASSAADSDDAAKAHTVNGMALLLKGELDNAREEFEIAKRSPAYNAEKRWAKVADAGIDAVKDPLALYRQPVVLPQVDVKAAIKSLDLGIHAYKRDDYRNAIKHLTDAARNDPADPIAWYFLGASHLAAGNTEQAENDIAQGVEREKVSPLAARVISESLKPIHGEARNAIDKARP